MAARAADRARDARLDAGAGQGRNAVSFAASPSSGSRGRGCRQAGSISTAHLATTAAAASARATSPTGAGRDAHAAAGAPADGATSAGSAPAARSCYTVPRGADHAGSGAVTF